ncbi:hypothetical protein UlMin_009140 [Ulmus minor]
MKNNFFENGRFETAVWAVKLMLIFIGTISTVTLLKATIVPYFSNLTLSTLPQIWKSLRSFLSPLSIYIILNFIIITIAASSTFQHKNQTQFHEKNEKENKKKNQIDSEDSTLLSSSTADKNNSTWDDFEILKEELTNNIKINTNRNERLSADENPSPEINSGENPAKKEEEEDTMEATWKAIIEGQGVGKGRQLKKSDTWDVAPRLVRADGQPEILAGDEEVDPAAWARRELKKSETFSDRVSLRRDKSMTPEELNQRAEAFIKKVNNEMRLQRLESDQRFIEMVHRGL